MHPPRRLTGFLRLHGRPLAGLALASLLAGAAWWISRRSGDLDIPQLTPTEIAALPDSDDGERSLLVHLTSRLYARGGLRPWRELEEPARHVWASLHVEDRLINGPLPPATSSGDEEPSLADATEAYRAFGADDAADLFGSDDAAAIHRRCTALLPAIRAARRAYVQAHAAEMR